MIQEYIMVLCNGVTEDQFNTLLSTCQGGDLHLAAPSEKVSDVLRMMKLDQVFQMFDSIESAKQSFF